MAIDALALSLALDGIRVSCDVDSLCDMFTILGNVGESHFIQMS